MNHDPESIVDEFMGDNLRVSDLRLMQEALRGRLEALRRERDAGGAAGTTLDREMATVRRQLAALRQEEIVSEFVESAVRVTLARPHGSEVEPDADGS